MLNWNPPPSSLAPTSRARTPVSAEADRRSHHQDRDRDRGAGDGAGAGAGRAGGCRGWCRCREPGTATTPPPDSAPPEPPGAIDPGADTKGLSRPP
jgi:hypothetical protein